MTDNVSQITMFFFSGLKDTMNYRIVLFSLTLLCYCLILLANITLIVTIIWDKNLHEPMYFLLCTFCMNTLYGTTGFFPKFLWDLLSPVHVISYSGCFVQAMVMFLFGCSDITILALMAFDRYVAIYRPLEYHFIMSNQRLIKLVSLSWIIPFCHLAINIIPTFRLKLCSPYIASLFCMNWFIVKLACFPAQTTINNIVATITIIFYQLHVLFILWSYMHLIKVCVNSLEKRAKFMQTCVPHLTSFSFFLVTNLFAVIITRVGSKYVPRTVLNFIEIEFLVIPPILNPLIYGFKLTKIRNRVLGIIVKDNDFCFSK